jgi:hypothetical protein
VQAAGFSVMEIDDSCRWSEHQTGGARQAGGGHDEYKPSAAIARRMPSKWPRPVWHAPWKLYRVISGHLG